jgi:hypothetical protein
MTTTPCPHCKQPVLWVPHKWLGAIPVDPKPVPGPGIVLNEDGSFDRVVVRGEGKRYKSHLATCPKGGLSMRDRPDEE